MVVSAHQKSDSTPNQNHQYIPENYCSTGKHLSPGVGMPEGKLPNL